VNGLIGRTISHYHILEQIGQGGMSSVFRAANLADGRAVAMKILSPYIAHEERFQARFEREIKLLTRLQHPNIIPILDFGEADGLAFIVMPYIASGTLLDRLNEGPLDPREGGKIVGQLSSALMLAHENGVIHRDVKPSNVLIDPHGNALLSDFSFARPQDASQNLTGSALIGTPAYMSPEQCRGDPIDARSDQYSFAVMLFQITTGALPFTGDTPMATALQHINVPLPRPRAVNPNLPEGIELVLIKALAKDPALRFDSLQALNQAFQSALAAALDPAGHAAANGKTLSAQRTLAMYRKYQNVKPPERQGRFQRSAVLAALLLLLACAVSAGTIAVIRDDLFARASAQGVGFSEADVQASVESGLATALAAGTVLPTGALETQIYSAFLAAVEATNVAAGSPSSTPSDTPTATATPGPLGSPTPTLTYPPGVTPPTATRTYPPGVTPPTPTRTPTPTETSTGPSDTPTTADTPTDTLQPTDTPVPPTDTPVPPTNTPQPTDTSNPTNTPRCSPWPWCRQTQTAAAGG
jgi:serine/threonine-protein kinase